MWIVLHNIIHPDSRDGGACYQIIWGFKIVFSLRYRVINSKVSNIWKVFWVTVHLDIVKYDYVRILHSCLMVCCPHCMLINCHLNQGILDCVIWHILPKSTTNPIEGVMCLHCKHADAACKREQVAPWILGKGEFTNNTCDDLTIMQSNLHSIFHSTKEKRTDCSGDDSSFEQCAPYSDTESIWQSLIRHARSPMHVSCTSPQGLQEKSLRWDPRRPCHHLNKWPLLGLAVHVMVFYYLGQSPSLIPHSPHQQPHYQHW